VLALNKVCNLEDFAHPDLRPVIRDVYAHELKRFGADFPTGHEYRKYWEVAMAVRAFSALGVTREDARVLAVGAGTEATVFWLTNHVAEVHATDLYLDSGDWSESANPSMLIDPSRYWPSKWNPRRLVAQHMDARALRYEDSTFDGVFSSSSIEHFGQPRDVRQAVEEMFRVLKPGGVLSLSTEFRLGGAGPGLPDILMFDADEIHENIVSRLPWTLSAPLDVTVSDATLATAQLFDDAARDVRSHVAKYGEILFHELDWSSYPHIVLRHGDLAWTSVHIALRKPA
jgi:SAM-dependent methyltransferase